ncbi:hypothetical protein QTP88_003750 [Uroleucon formosanum]
MISDSKQEAYTNDEELITKVGANNVDIIRDWLLKQPHLPKISDKQLVIFLNCCQCKLETTKKMIDAYYTMRTHNPDMFSNRSISELEKTFNIFYFHKMPLLPDGSRAGFSRLRDFNSNVFNTLDTIRLVFAMYDVCIDEDPLAQEWKFVMDMTGFSMGHLTKLTNLTLMKKCMTYVQMALPMRLTAIHFINAPPLANQLMMFLKPIMHKDLYSMISIHPVSDMDSVYKFIPKKYFSSDMGGEAPSFEARKEESQKRFKSYQIFFDNDEKFNRIDESKRIDKNNRFISTNYGLEGSFKKLELD